MADVDNRTNIGGSIIQLHALALTPVQIQAQ